MGMMKMSERLIQDGFARTPHLTQVQYCGSDLIMYHFFGRNGDVFTHWRIGVKTLSMMKCIKLYSWESFYQMIYQIRIGSLQ